MVDTVLCNVIEAHHSAGVQISMGKRCLALEYQGSLNVDRKVTICFACLLSDITHFRVQIFCLEVMIKINRVRRLPLLSNIIESTCKDYVEFFSSLGV